jgi:putative exosortase-associated protein (TIGR04073 family)
MRNALSLIALLAVVATITSGCKGPEEKLGRGVRNTCDIVRLGGLRESMEQTAVWDSPSDAATTGVVKGIDLTLARTGVGIYEVITFPLPPYRPVCTNYLSPQPNYPSNYKPDMSADPLYYTDQHIGFSGGTAAGFIPGSQFDVLGN